MAYTEQQKEEQVTYEAPPKLTEWTNEPTCYDLKQDLQEASQHHDAHVNDVNRWLDNMNVKGNARHPKVKGRSSVVPKLIRKQAEWRYAALSEAFLADEDIFDTAPVTWEDTKAARQNGLILNHQFNHLIDKVTFIDDYVRTAVDEGTVVVRVGWKTRRGTVQEPNYVEEPADPFLVPILEQAIQMLLQKPEGLSELPPELARHIQATIENGTPTQVVQKGFKSVEKEIVNQPTVDVCDYNSVILDPSCKGQIKNANFVIYKFETSLSDLRKAGLYKNLDYIMTDKTAIQHDTDKSPTSDQTNFNFKDEPRKKFNAYEYWGYWDIDGSGETKPIVATWAGETLIRMEESPFPDEGLPFVAVQYLPKRKNVYGEPDGELLEDNQKIVGAATRGILDILGRSAAGQTGVRKDALDVTNQRKFDAGRDYQFNAHVDPALAFFTHTFPEIPQSAQWILEQQNFDAESMTGVRAFANTGVSGEGLGRSATAARSALDSASKREIGILRRLGNGMIEIGRKIMAMNAIFLSEEEIVRVTNDQFEVIKRDDLAGRVDIKLQISTAETDNAKAQELAFMLQTNGPNSDPAEVRMIRAEIARLRKMPDLAKRIETYEPQPDPLQQQLVQLQIAREQKEIEKIEAEIQRMATEGQENLAEAELDRAKARQAHSEADLADLDFTEQESGVKQEREKELLGAQAEGNASRDILQAFLKGSNGQGASST
jgi:hypothetical protein